jgi:UDP-N-acetyl-2-amino-2-deoxyglucuronate dehydrogenase
MKNINIGLVGCGRISEKHLEAILFHKKKFNLVAICDNEQKKIDNTNIAGEYNKYLSIHEMIEKENLDLVSICTPSGNHPEHAIICAKKNINIITEKPMATDLNQAKNMIKSCNENDVKLFVVKQNRYNKTLVKLKKSIEEKRFGQLRLISVNVFWHRDQNYYDQAPWRGTIKYDGGALMNQASHYVDLLIWLFGPIKNVHAFSTKARKIEAEDTIVLNIEFENRSLGSMCVTMLTYDQNLEGSLTVMGDKGTVKVGGKAVNEIEHWNFDSDSPNDNDIRNVNYKINDIYGKGHIQFYEEVYKSMNNEKSEITRGEDGLKSLEVILAAYESVIKREIIPLPLS